MTMILAILSDGPRHGYDVAREVERRSRNRITFTDGALYPILHALEQEGLIDSHWEQSVGERRRRVYSLNSDGEREFKRQVVQWQEFSQAVNDVLTLDVSD